MQAARASAIIILGMHRSGTSLVAELVLRWGAFTPEAAMLPGDDGNPRGYWEFAPLARLNDELLALLGSRWNVPPADEGKPLLASLALDPTLRDRAQIMLSTMREAGRPWFWKDPRLTVLLPFWKPLWDEVLYLVPVRDPGAIAVSLERRDSASTRSSFLLWQRYMTEIAGEADVASRVLFVNYERLVSDPLSESRALCQALDDRLGVIAPRPDLRAEQMAAAVDPRLQRSLHHSDFVENPLASDGQKELYQSLRTATRGGPHAVPHVALPHDWREQLAAEDLLQRTGVLRARCQVYWRPIESGYAEHRSRSAPVRMDGTAQTVTIAIDPQQPPIAALRLDLSDRPASVSITELTLRDRAGNAVWTLDPAALHTHEIGLCQPLLGESGLFLRLDSYDSWVELILTESQAAALASVELHCTYTSSLEHMLLCGAHGAARTALRAESLSARCDELQQQLLSASQTRQVKEAEHQNRNRDHELRRQEQQRHIELLEEKLAEIQQTVDRSLTSRLRRVFQSKR